MPAAGAPVLATDYQRWRVKAVQNTVQALAAATFTAVSFDGADEVDDLNVHDSVTNNSRVLLGLAVGWWLVMGHTAWGAATGKGIRSRLVLNGVTGINGSYDSAPAITATTGGFITTNSVGLVQVTNAADYIQLQAYTETAGSTTVSGDLRCALSAVYQGP
jgi:hypothetical protein